MRRFNITVNGKAYDVAVEEVNGAAPAPVASISGETNNITLGPITLEHGSIAVGGTSGVVATIRISGY